MNLNFAETAIARALHTAQGELSGYKNALEAHVQSDYEAVKARLEEAIKHFEGEVAALKQRVHPRVLEHVTEGQSAHDALNLTLNDAPTKAEAETTAAEEAAAAEAAQKAAEKAAAEAQAAADAEAAVEAAAPVPVAEAQA